MKKRRIIVIGGGPAGLMAAGIAAQAGASTILFEKMNCPGRKLLITGHNRCNITNGSPLDQFVEKFGPNGKFLRYAFSRFFVPDLIKFLAQLGVKTKIDPMGRIFPESERAIDVRDALVGWVNRSGVDIRKVSPVKRLLIDQSHLKGVEMSGDFRGGKGSVSKKAHDAYAFSAEAVIIATGGASYPATGSTGDGYRFAREAGHYIVPIRPALVPIVTKGEIASRLQGLSLKVVGVRLVINGKLRRDKLHNYGEILFTHFGLSGPLILSLSKQVVDSFQMGHKVHISIDLAPSYEEGELENYFIRQTQAFGRRRISSFLGELVPGRMIPLILELADIPLAKVSSQVAASERKRLLNYLKDFRLEVSGFRPFTEAMVTAGGVETREVDPRTMESRIIKDLYFAGEVMDIDGDTGGYNLQAAFSTGWVAGNSAARVSN